MCDYSLHGIPSRLAEKDEVLVVHRFYTGSKGITSPQLLKPIEPTKGLLGMIAHMWRRSIQPSVCAVCIPDGAKLMLHEIPEKLQQVCGVTADELVTFRQLSMEERTYRDAIEFRSGVRVRLQELREGQRIEVLALSLENEADQAKTLLAAEA